jgi:hypothetical protein
MPKERTMLKSIFECVTGVRSLRCPPKKNDRGYKCECQVMKVVRKDRQRERASERATRRNENQTLSDRSHHSAAALSNPTGKKRARMANGGGSVPVWLQARPGAI